MAQVIEAVYENGVIKPLEKIEMKEGKITVVVMERDKRRTLENFFGILKNEKINVEKERDKKIEEREMK